MRMLIGRRIVAIVEGDITKLEVDAIVNAANSKLVGGGGVDGAIHNAAGPEMTAECEKLYFCPTGGAVATHAGRLRARWVFHAVGPVWSDGDRREPELLRRTYEACLKLAVEKGCRTIAFPAISAGTFAYPLPAATEMALTTVGEHLAGETCVEVVTLVMYGRNAYDDGRRVTRRIAESRRWPITEDE